ncbi:MAG: SDR family NAD(P)-dependent oxidoreductase [Xenococcaceae cyanobacterium]
MSMNNLDPSISPIKRALRAVEDMKTKLEAMEYAKSEPIAIIGMGCRFPGNANTPEKFWELLRNGEDAVTEIPPQRWDVDAYYDPNPDTPGKMYVRNAALISRVDGFDPQFFGISPREATSLDPQQRLLLEVTWEALERAGINPQQLENTQTGVFLGIGQNDYAHLNFSRLEQIGTYDSTGNGFCFAAGRLSYFFRLQGPSMAIDTACSASLVALHQACQSLRSGESNLALAGGVQLILSPLVTTALSRLKALSPDGRCKTFDAAADGYGRGEGCGMVVLKRLSEAIEDGDNILALILGSAVNHDGPSSGLTVPNKLAQEKLIQQALKAAKIEPNQVSYVEAHGTGTSLGDPIEVRALATVFGQGHDRENPLAIASVKTNIGHLEAAAGIASLIKVVLQLQHQEIAPHLHLKNPNPYIDWENLPLKVPTQPTPWLSPEGKRVAGVSSFAISGTNAHVILSETPFQGNRQQCAQRRRRRLGATGNRERPLHILTLSAKTEKALSELVSLYYNYLENNGELELADICYTANTGRAHFKHRLAAIASDKQELAEKLKAPEEVTGLFSGQLPDSVPKIAFLFTGQGSQYVNMGRELYETQPVFRQALIECDRLLVPYLEHNLLLVIYPRKESGAKAQLRASLLNQTEYTQPALFAIEYALAQLWQSWGIKPNVVMGHSVGEYVAATVAGVFSLEDSLKLIATRGMLMQKLPSGGKMVSVMASEERVREFITPYGNKVDIAAINGPESVVISGEAEAIEAICSNLESLKIKTKQLQVSHPFHSPLMSPMLAEFEAAAKQVTYHQPQIPLISNVTGVLAGDRMTKPSYWVSHVRQPVRFAQSMETLHELGYEIFLEIGPKPILLGMGRQCLPANVGVWLPSLRPSNKQAPEFIGENNPKSIPPYPPFKRGGIQNPKSDDWQQLLSSLGQLYVRGVKVDWSGFDGDYARQKLVLPTYPFQRQRYWIETSQHGEQKLEANTIKDWFYQVQWKPLASRQQKTRIELLHWLILADTTGVGEKLANLLQQQGHECSLVYRGDCYQNEKAGIYQINPSEPGEFERVYQTILETSQLPLEKVIHLWSLDAPASEDLTITALEEAEGSGCGSVLHLVQTLLKTTATPQLWLVTRQAISVLSKTDEVAVARSPLWGLGKVVSLEHSRLWGGLVDLDYPAPEDEVNLLVQLLADNSGEDCLAIRSEQTYVARLVKQPPKPSQPISLDSDATYLITGGLGALGLHTAQWMVEKGARHLVLIGRSQPDEEKMAAIAHLQQQGAEVVVARADVSRWEEVERVFAQIDTDLPPLKGIVHAAGVGGFQLIEEIELTQLEAVMRPKVIGGWILHQLTQNRELDFFVGFSSIAAVWGSAGQAHYGASNHFLDGLVHYRRAKGLPALSINWGPWSGGGMTSEEDLGELNKRGVKPITPSQGIAALEQLWGGDRVQTTVADVNWSLFKQLYQVGRRRLFLEEIEVPPQETKPSTSKQKAEILAHFISTQSEAQTKYHQLKEQLKVVSDGERENILIPYLQGEIARILAMTVDRIDIQQPLNQIGLDSLMALELRNQVQSQLEVDVPITKFIEGITIADLSAEINHQLTQTDRNQGIESEVNGQVNRMHVKESEFVEGEL